MDRPITSEESEACKAAPQFSKLRAVDLFGSRADYNLAARVARENIVRYRELKTEWEYESGIRPRPSEFYG